MLTFKNIRILIDQNECLKWMNLKMDIKRNTSEIMSDKFRASNSQFKFNLFTSELDKFQQLLESVMELFKSSRLFPILSSMLKNLEVIWDIDQDEVKNKDKIEERSHSIFGKEIRFKDLDFPIDNYKLEYIIENNETIDDIKKELQESIPPCSQSESNIEATFNKFHNLVKVRHYLSTTDLTSKSLHLSLIALSSLQEIFLRIRGRFAYQDPIETYMAMTKRNGGEKYFETFKINDFELILDMNQESSINYLGEAYKFKRLPQIDTLKIFNARNENYNLKYFLTLVDRYKINRFVFDGNIKERLNGENIISFYLQSMDSALRSKDVKLSN